MSTKHAFVTGGTGFLGVNLIELLRKEGWDVTAIYRDESKTAFLKSLNVNLLPGTIDDEKTLVDAIPNGVDAVFHVAADVSFWRANNARQTSTNVDGTRNILNAALKKKVKRFVHTSSIAAYGMHKKPITEQTRKIGQNSNINYLRTKALAEEEVRKAIRAGLDAVILNPANIVGPHDAKNWGRLFQVVKDRALPGVPPGFGSFCHSVEVARAHIAAVDHGKTGENYLLGGPAASYRECFETVIKLLGVPMEINMTPPIVLKSVAVVSDFVSMFTHKYPTLTPEMAEVLCGNIVCKSDKAEKVLNYKVVSLEQMFGDCYEWLISNNRMTRPEPAHQ
jgi:nucleoside-diphosphate-sugar epimerase